MKRPWMPLNVGDFVADTQHLGATETGIYIRLIMHCWQHGTIPRDERQLALISHCDTRLWHQYRTVLQFFDVVDASTMHHKRVSAELLRCQEIFNKRSGAAQQMHTKCKSFAGVLHDDLHTHSHSHSQSLKSGNGFCKQEGFSAMPSSKEFTNWKAYAFEKNIPLWRELQKREEEGRAFNFETQWPPKIS